MSSSPSSAAQGGVRRFRLQRRQLGEVGAGAEVVSRTRGSTSTFTSSSTLAACSKLGVAQPGADRHRVELVRAVERDGRDLGCPVLAVKDQLFRRRHGSFRHSTSDQGSRARCG